MSENKIKNGEQDAKSEELIDFAVTARKYKTLLTTKYKERKPWVNPNPYDIQSSIPGTIIKILVKEKQIVKEGEPILILEAMKMQNRIEMPFTARIKKINVSEGEKIPKEFLMIELAPADEK
ncbi:acetyl-CoA carboxylase biotin carboxyl carrier protein subunit [Paludibacter sp. 221]|uniref:acetyl-CoA carboxylase biotin carboxyl carrier protein subunit n=1 Tax=Paludibacter sp. 221 TaxID=2302939 RepID=UPI0013D1E6F8|nr:acetyl-CoA carboxylase biotin carboxyl carrier protein subunit [Paludibacter sp. 221]NDV46886.1 acetyl-CoA carboxylase biotin carboxyl carrier protein subunit [Paludibacter sp. 221]